MNIILQLAGAGDFYIASVRKCTGNRWALRGVTLNSNGVLKGTANVLYFESRKEAEKKCRKRAKIKQARKSYAIVGVDALPKEALRFLAPDPDSVISIEEMVELIDKAKRERYVFFKNVMGIEHLFQLGLEYLAYITDDEDILEVEADNGERHSCIMERFSEVKETETALQVLGTNLS